MITEIEVKNVDATKTMHMIALHLIAKGYRYIEPKQAGGIAARFKVSREQMQAAIILADRIRRQQQLFEKRPTFRVDGLVEISAPIDLEQILCVNAQQRRSHPRRSRHLRPTSSLEPGPRT